MNNPFGEHLNSNKMMVGLSYDDVLLIPKRSRIESRSAVSTDTRITKDIVLHIPILSANMDTVTEAEMAIAMAREGGLGVIHRFMPIEQETANVKRVKRAEAYVIEKPYSIRKNETVSKARDTMYRNGVGSLLVVDSGNKLLGILSDRDIRFAKDEGSAISKYMTPRGRMIVGAPGIGMNDALKVLDDNRLEKLPIVDGNNVVRGLITSKDIYRRTRSDKTAKDKKGRLYVGASIGIRGDYIERAIALAEAEADLLILDVAHGHTESVIAAVKKVKKELPRVPLVAGNVATADGVRDLASAGADIIKVGIGPGAACITRRVTGAGMPQLTAVMECHSAAVESGVTIIADGGIRQSGDITKALAAGAETVMIGSLLAGTDESPGYFVSRNGVKYKAYRGMASLSANISRKRLDKGVIDPQEVYDIVPEGVESAVPYRGRLSEVLAQLVGGLRSGMSYSGAADLEELRKNATFVRLTNGAARESYEKLG